MKHKAEKLKAVWFRLAVVITGIFTIGVVINVKENVNDGTAFYPLILIYIIVYAGIWVFWGTVRWLLSPFLNSTDEEK